MSNNLIITEIKENLKAQVELADRIYLLQRAMYEAVMNRDWPGSEKQLKALEQATAEFSELDKKSYVFLGASVKGNGKMDFFSEKDQIELKGLYNRLKEKLYFSKIENESFSAYISHARSLVQGMVDIICEDRGGKRYTNTGKRVSVDMTSLVLNEVL